MTNCSACKTDEIPVVSCDKCSVKFCEKCAPLTSTEWRSVILKKRKIIFLCGDCKQLFEQFMQADFADDTGSFQAMDLLKEIIMKMDRGVDMIEQTKLQVATVVEGLLANFARNLESKISDVRAEVAILKNSNTDLVRLKSTGTSVTSGGKGAVPKNLHANSNKAKIKDRNKHSESITCQNEVAASANVSVGSEKSVAPLLSEGDSSRDNMIKNSSQQQVIMISQLSNAINALDEPGLTTNKLEIVQTNESPSSESAWIKVGGGRRNRAPRTTDDTNTIQRKRIRPIQGSSETQTLLKSVPKAGYIHVSRLDPATRAEDVQEFAARICRVLRCESLASKHPESYSSFKLTVPCENIGLLLNADLWPKGVLVQRFFHRGLPRQIST